MNAIKHRSPAFPKKLGFLRLCSAWMFVAACLPVLTFAGENAVPSPGPQIAAAITIADVRPHVEYLAGPDLRGRGDPQSKRLASDYIKTHFERLGLQPLFAEGDYFQSIP